ncbi:sensor histidine kinase [Alkaliphilus sp. MSJ-5]|uniref:histidine kinase n=1 Tax=Alkaliphilus flagellatus TaxID=2841507 RepID=A0ABS6G7I8_9FIRM|nr:sensor histidine kinase [Alkaliphilus flagellatus]MBU5678086.1 sensor histidine kinase [Alkaliphilus flagellatus]
MIKEKKYRYYIRWLILILILLNILFSFKDNVTILILYLCLYVVIIVNDRIRIRGMTSYKEYYISLTVSVVLSAALAYLVGGYTQIYMYVVIYEIILFNSGKYPLFLLIVEILMILFGRAVLNANINPISIPEYLKETIFDFFAMSAFLLFYCLSIYSYKSLFIEKRKVEKLHDKLKQSYDILNEQSKNIKELTITKERNRVAQEIHDTLGHSLIALNMNLDVAHKMLDIDNIKTKELINKSQILTKECMNNLRDAVYTLKEDNNTLIKLIQKMADNIESTGTVKIDINIDEEVEGMKAEYNRIIYTTIKEGITNSIKHGQSDRISINVGLNKDNVRISIEDNGLGCENLVKSNGLLGIEDRISEVGGLINYDFSVSKGFKIEIYLPIENPVIFKCSEI